MEKEKIICKHYLRNCEVLSPCCSQYVPCRLCHDSIYKSFSCKVDTMDRFSIAKMRCLLCKAESPVQQTCSSCQKEMASYYCDICHLFEDNKNKKIFHCEDCGICRVGLREQFFHCKTCKGCFNKNVEHDKCIENVFDQNCPICLENLFNSRKTPTQLECKHWLHNKCLVDLYKNANNFINCPVCGKAIGKDEGLNKFIEKFAEEAKKNLPEELKDKKIKIFCHSCMKSASDVEFNFYVKCPNCESFNTKEII